MEEICNKWKKSGFFITISVLTIFFLTTGLRNIPNNGFIPFKGEVRDLFRFLSTVPKESVVAGNPYALDCVPLFSKRS